MRHIAGLIAVLAAVRVAAFGVSAMSGSISGTVTEAGGCGAACVAVSARPGSQSTATDGDGRFTISGLKAGSYAVTVSRGRRVLQSKGNVRVRPGNAALVSFEVPARSLLEKHSRLLVLICAGVFIILLSVAIKYSLAGPPREESGES